MSLENAMPNSLLGEMWRRIDWQVYEDILRSYQREIALAAIKKNQSSVYSAQRRLVQSIEAKALAVKHVCDSVSQPGIDGVKWTTAAEKMRAANLLNPPKYIAQPTRLLKITQKSSGKERHVQIPVYFDRAMHTLHAYALDPVAESTGDKKSFAFRKGRSADDVHSYIIRMFDNPNPPRYVLKADVKACYGSISHKWLMQNIPTEREVLYQFLKAGHVLGGSLFPADEFGISLGSALSPILANMTLDGLQTAIYYNLRNENTKGMDYADGDLIRYADDMLITARTRETAEKIKEILVSFLSVRGLRLSEEKTQIIDTRNDGFDFLNRHYRYLNSNVFIGEPSKEAIAKMTQKLRELITPYIGGQKALIETINKKLTGWGTYYKCTNAQIAFRDIDTVVRTLLLDLCERLHPTMSRLKILERYFYYVEPDGTSVYTLKDKPDVRVNRLVNTLLVKHHPIAVSMNPYLDVYYYDARMNARAIKSITGKFRQVWERQSGKCFYCGEDLLIDNEKRIVPINPVDPEVTNNMAYVHEHCAAGQPEMYISEKVIDNGFDVRQLLEEIADRPDVGSRGYKYFRLTDHFRDRNDPLIKLTFAEIEKILGCQMCDSAYKYSNYWTGRNPATMSQCWTSNGYQVRSVDMKKNHVVFERKKEMDGLASVVIPPIILTGRIPEKAVIEIHNCLDSVMKKYGLCKDPNKGRPQYKNRP